MGGCFRTLSVTISSRHPAARRSRHNTFPYFTLTYLHLALPDLTRCKEITSQRDAANDERAKSSEQLVVSVAAQRAAEEKVPNPASPTLISNPDTRPTVARWLLCLLVVQPS